MGAVLKVAEAQRSLEQEALAAGRHLAAQPHLAVQPRLAAQPARQVVARVPLRVRVARP